VNNPASNSPASAGGCLLVVAVLVLLVWTWPWWLLLLPIIWLLVLIGNETLRHQFRVLFGNEDLEPKTHRTRKSLLKLTVIAALISGALCVAAVRETELQWYLIPLTFVIASSRLYALDCKLRPFPNLQRALCDNILELH